MGAIEQKNKEILALSISKEKICLCQRFIVRFIKIPRNHPINRWCGTWYPQSCRFLNLDRHIHFHYEKSVIWRTIQHIKDRIESLNDYFLCRLKNYKLKHLNRLYLFANYYDSELDIVNWTESQIFIYIHWLLNRGYLVFNSDWSYL